jgi:hypothetical protein
LAATALGALGTGTTVGGWIGPRHAAAPSALTADHGARLSGSGASGQAVVCGAGFEALLEASARALLVEVRAEFAPPAWLLGERLGSSLPCSAAQAVASTVSAAAQLKRWRRFAAEGDALVTVIVRGLIRGLL